MKVVEGGLRAGKTFNKDVDTTCKYFRTLQICAIDNEKPICRECGCYTRRGRRYLNG